MNIRDAITHASAEFLKQGYEQAAFEAREVLKWSTGFSAADMIANDLSVLNPEQQKKFTAFLTERLKGVPMAHLSEEKGFFKHVFKVEKGVLVPRPESELVVEVSLRRAAMVPLQMKQIADLGAGTGCIGLSVLYEWQQAKLWAVELSPKAAALIVKNAEALKIYDRVHVDCIAVESWKPETKFDLIMANPPYIPEGDPKVQKSVHEHEPHAALYSGADGLDAIRTWIPLAFKLLNPGGLCIFEIGAGQIEAVSSIMMNAGFHDIERTRDLAGFERVISARREGLFHGQNGG